MRTHILLSSILFVAVALFHAFRAIYDLPLIIGTVPISTSVSWVVAILLLFMAASGIYRIRK